MSCLSEHCHADLDNFAKRAVLPAYLPVKTIHLVQREYPTNDASDFAHRRAELTVLLLVAQTGF
jgi:hypothetical protein